MRRATLAIAVACLSCSGSTHLAADAAPEAAPAADGPPESAADSGCVPRNCYNGYVAACGNCLDDDADGVADMADPNCLSPCDDTEDSLSIHSPPPDEERPCEYDCAFDDNGGHGDDKCDHRTSCDPLAVAPSYAPDGPSCAYTGAAICASTATQLNSCQDFCLPLVPNGCDCFGCCELVPKSGSYVWLNSKGAGGEATCRSLIDAADPAKCHPCTPVPSCLNPCDDCEICIGRTAVAPTCGTARTCPSGRPCEAATSATDCPAGSYCLTGCCVGG